MRLLADVNVWVALAISRHIHHSDAVGWFDSLSDRDSVYFCRVTQQGFLRLVTTTAALGTDAVSNDLAWDGYLRLRRDPRIHWIEEPEGLDELWMRWGRAKDSSPKKWMDAYLAAFARLHGLRLVTFDRGFRVYPGLDWMAPRAPKAK
jgi:toxin-antitoxin system PIN domain toxin